MHRPEQAKRASEAQAAVGTVGDKFDKQIARGNVTRYAEQIKFLDERIEGLVQTVRNFQADLDMDDANATLNAHGETIDATADEYDNLTFHINEAAHAITDFSSR